MIQFYVKSTDEFYMKMHPKCTLFDSGIFNQISQALNS